MTGFSSTGYRAIYLVFPTSEPLAALWTRLLLFVPYAFVHLFERAATTTLRPARCFSVAINTVFWKFTRGREFATMQRFMARHTKGDAVTNINSKFRKVSQWLDVVSMKIALRSTVLAFVIVALKYCFAPNSQIAFETRAEPMCCATALPCRCFCANHGLATARARTEARALVSTIECDATIETLTRLRRIASRPARFGAVMGGVGTIGFNLKFVAALLASLCDLGVFHRSIIPHLNEYRKQRWADSTGQTPVLVE